ncbi:MAG TPA: cytochrome C551 [Candidatus Kaiserbacteria bacterium]|nr:cytochrome C551 [Candidatus Kaiserbacteria bacterium]
MYSKTDYNDVDLICICGKSFIWLAGEQEFINNLFANGKIKEIIEPKRCPACRKKKKDHFNKSN